MGLYSRFDVIVSARGGGKGTGEASMGGGCWFEDPGWGVGAADISEPGDHCKSGGALQDWLRGGGSSFPAPASSGSANLQPPGHECGRSPEAADAVPGGGPFLPAPRKPGGRHRPHCSGAGTLGPLSKHPVPASPGPHFSAQFCCSVPACKPVNVESTGLQGKDSRQLTTAQSGQH